MSKKRNKKEGFHCCMKTCKNRHHRDVTEEPSLVSLNKFKILGIEEQKNKKGDSAEVLASRHTVATFAKELKTNVPYSPDVPFTNYKFYYYGDPRSGFRTKSGTQNFTKLHEDYLRRKILFEDPEFPAEYSTLFYISPNPFKKKRKPIRWLRPHQIVKSPLFFSNGYHRFDVAQGSLGDCWFLAAVASLTMYPYLFEFIVPIDQYFDKDYAGIFHFRFWQFGVWVDVVVDDRLPTLNGQLLYVRSVHPGEFWSALLEKAYAKLYGSYQCLQEGITHDAQEDFTGGLGELICIKESPVNLFEIISKADERMSLMSCAMEAKQEFREQKTKDGLVRGHSYSITKITYITKNDDKIPLIRLRNPWGYHEWKGAWSDGSPEWESLSTKTREELGLIFQEDGEFWMSFKDFLSNFDYLDICNLTPDSIIVQKTSCKEKKTWEVLVFEGAWVNGVTAGGSLSYKETFHTNPQFIVTLSEPDDDDDQRKCTLIISLMHKGRQQAHGPYVPSIMIYIYDLPDPETAPKPLDYDFFNLCTPRHFCEPECRRGNSLHVKLPPGTYCVIPCTEKTNREVPFVLRAFSEKKFEMKEYDRDVKCQYIETMIPPKRVLDKTNMKKEFLKAAGLDEAIDFKELQTFLNKKFQEIKGFVGFSNYMCRALISMMDIDRSGKMEYEEFLTLYDQLIIWTDLWSSLQKFGCMMGSNLRSALLKSGITCNYQVLNILMNRYSDGDGKLTFEDFLMCCIKLKTMIDIFMRFQQNDKVNFNENEWLEVTLSN